jgi:trehalose 6-phosphate synthase
VAGRRSLIIASNRGPVTFDRGPDGARIERRGGGGLVTALRGLLEHHDVTWIAAATTDEDRVVAREKSSDVAFVAPELDAYHGYYNVVANPMLWFIQHGLWGDSDPTSTRRSTRRGALHETVNRLFAERIVVELDNRPSAAVLFQDYHLYLAPGCVRAARPDAKLAHFVHIPWPVDWTILPEAMRRAVHEGLLANDVVGFHTARWARNFEGSCAEIVGGCGRTHVTHHAISIDTDEFDELAQSPDVLAEEEQMRHRGRRSSSSGSIEPTRRRTSCAASKRSACCSTPVPSGAAGRGSTRCSIRRGRRFPSMSSTWRRSSERPRT